MHLEVIHDTPSVSVLAALTGDTQRSVCLIPRSAHGTNPASAAMMGFEIVWLDDDGNSMIIDSAIWE